MADQRLSELYRVTAQEWVELESAAHVLEECKSANFSQLVVAKGDAPITRAEHQAKASAQWLEYLWSMTKARKAANAKKVEIEWIKMRFQEQMSEEANNRSERRL